jgi:hypothetical protein
VKVCPAAVSVPVRDVAPVFAATLKDTFPFPAPLPPETSVIHPVLAAAVQEHPLPLITPNEPVPTAEEKEELLAERA